MIPAIFTACKSNSCRDLWLRPSTRTVLGVLAGLLVLAMFDRMTRKAASVVFSRR